MLWFYLKIIIVISLYHAFSVNGDIDRLYVSWSMGGKGLFSVADVIACQCSSL